MRAVEDDHVDRPGVEVQQCMKLTGTNRSIGLIVLIAYAHRTSVDDVVLSSRCRRQGGCAADGAPDVRRLGFAGCCRDPACCKDKNKKRRVHKTKWGLDPNQLLIWFRTVARAQSCPLPTWCLLRGGCTRSHSEHGRETPLRQWYSVLRRGRVGRCQVCKRQE